MRTRTVWVLPQDDSCQLPNNCHNSPLGPVGASRGAKRGIDDGGGGGDEHGRDGGTGRGGGEADGPVGDEWYKEGVETLTSK